MPPVALKPIAGTQLQGNADANKRYFNSRGIGALEMVGAITEAEKELLARADSVGAANEDSFVDTDELNYLFGGEEHGSLFANEKQTLLKLWSKFELSSVAASPFHQLTKLAGTVIDGKAPGSTLYDPVKITSLPQNLQKVAQRIQLVHDGDSVSTTIQYKDVLDAKALPRRYTAAERAQLGQLETWFKANAKVTAGAVPQTRLSVPMGKQTVPLVTSGALSISAQMQNSVHKRQIDAPAESWGTRRRYAEDLSLVREVRSVDLVVPPGHKALVTFADGGNHVLGPGAQSFQPSADGQCVVELFDASGNEVSEASFHFVRRDEAQLPNSYGHQLVDSLGTKLEPQLEGYAAHSNIEQANWSFVPIGTAVHNTKSGALADVKARMDLPTSTLADGAYKTTLENGISLSFEKYASGAAKFSFQEPGGASWSGYMQPYAAAGVRRVLYAQNAGQMFEFDPSTNTLKTPWGERTLNELNLVH